MNAIHEHRHARGRNARVLIQYKRVPRSDKRTRQHSHHNGIIDVYDNPDFLGFRNDINVSFNGAGTRYIHDDLMHSGR